MTKESKKLILKPREMGNHYGMAIALYDSILKLEIGQKLAICRAKGNIILQRVEEQTHDKRK